jgi:putative membrane protein
VTSAAAVVGGTVDPHASHAAVGDAHPMAWVVPVAVAVVLVAPYLRAVASVQAATGRRCSRPRTWSFTVGALVVATATSPLVEHAAAGTAARAHMLQHVALGMAAPLLLVLAAPVTLALASLPVGRRRTAVRALASRPARVLTHPLTAATVHVGGLFALYLTPLYAATLRSAAAHHLVLLHFLAAGCLFAWSLAGPERAARRPGLVVRVTVLVAASGAHGYLAKLLYARAPRLPVGSPQSAAQLQDAAQWMYYAGDVTELALAAAIFAAWYRRSGVRATTGPQVQDVRSR